MLVGVGLTDKRDLITAIKIQLLNFITRLATVDNSVDNSVENFQIGILYPPRVKVGSSNSNSDTTTNLTKNNLM